MKTAFDINNLHRSRQKKIITGLAAGIARQWDFDVFYVRVAMIVGMFIAPMGVGMSYLIASLLVKER
jgi:phage shock protein PspC (stress-responsive transcriptional regulator)